MGQRHNPRTNLITMLIWLLCGVGIASILAAISAPVNDANAVGLNLIAAALSFGLLLNAIVNRPVDRS